MNRRQVLSGVGFLAAAATTVEQGQSQSSAGVANKAVLATASDCVSKGQLCLSHCLDMLATGDKSMGHAPRPRGKCWRFAARCSRSPRKAPLYFQVCDGLSRRLQTL